MATSMGKKKHIYVIDYLKAVSILMVIFTHYNWKDKSGLFFTLVIAMAVPIFMLLTSNNFTMSYERKTTGALRELYGLSSLLPRIVRFTIPFAIIYALEIYLQYILKGTVLSLPAVLRNFCTGGFGPGSYYYPLLMQLLFVFPLIYLLVKHFRWRGIIAVAAINYAYEFAVWYGGMSGPTYRLLLFRYLLYLAFGCYMYFHIREREQGGPAAERRYPMPWYVLLILFGIGLAYLLWAYCPGYHAAQLRVFRRWAKTAMPTACYIFPMVCLLLRHCGEKRLPAWPHVLLSEIGKASYHIFLVQMLYFRLFDHLVFPPSPAIPVALGNVVVATLLGYAYYRVENFYISGKIGSKLDAYLRRNKEVSR